MPDYLSAILLRRPCICIAVKLVEDLLQPIRRKPRSLPKLSGRWLNERVRIERVTLGVHGRLDVKTEPCPNEWPACNRVGIGCQHPTFMLMVAQDLHQAPKAELDV